MKNLLISFLICLGVLLPLGAMEDRNNNSSENNIPFLGSTPTDNQHDDMMAILTALNNLPQLLVTQPPAVQYPIYMPAQPNNGALLLQNNNALAVNYGNVPWQLVSSVEQNSTTRQRRRVTEGDNVVSALDAVRNATISVQQFVRRVVDPITGRRKIQRRTLKKGKFVTNSLHTTIFRNNGGNDDNNGGAGSAPGATLGF